jgi:anti-sigma factor RsiW
MMHEEIEELLGAYALDATEQAERAQVEAHLAECPRCRAEVAAHLEMAALLGSAATEAPPGLWDKIASSIAEDNRGPVSEPPAPVLALRVGGRAPRSAPKRRRAVVWSAVATLAAAVMALLGVEVAQLHGQVGRLHKELSIAGLTLSANQLDAGPHHTVRLVSTDRQPAATVIVARSGAAYWLWSSLHTLPTSQTYQLWGLSHGKPVSLALVGAHPNAVDFFKLEPDVTELLVTAEPEGGTPGPTTAVLAEGAVPSAAVN